MLKLTFLCSSAEHPVNRKIEQWIIEYGARFDVSVARSKKDLHSGDYLFLISCNDIIKAEDRALFRHTLVLHASDLPYGRGWSPHIWQILDGRDTIIMTLMEAADLVDTGKIVKKISVKIPKDALSDEINELIFDAELELVNFALEISEKHMSYPQSSAVMPTYFRKRTPADSEIDPAKSIAEQFNLLRVCDPERFPAFFELEGFRYELLIRKTGRVKESIHSSDTDP